MPHKILLIDDSITQLGFLKLQFEKAGFQVETAKDGAEGYRKVFEVAPDIVMSDIIMPNLNGYQFCRLLKNNPLSTEIPVILLTVLDKKIDKFWANKSGADKFISKTTLFEDIIVTVNEMIHKKPISDSYKETLLKNSVGEESVQNQINNILDDLLMTSTFLNEFRDLGEFVSHEKVLIEKSFKLLSSFVDYNVAGLFFNNMDKNEKLILHLDIVKSPVSNFVIEKIKRDFFAQMPGTREFSIRDFGHDIVREKNDDGLKVVSVDEFATAHFIPIFAEEKFLGGLCFYSKDAFKYSEFKFYKTMVSELTLLFNMRYLYSETEYLSVTDGLTGLYNRRHFEANAEREFLRTRRYPADLSLALIDIDYFKKVNDTFGHQFGDYVLKEISGLVSGSFRKTDMVYRYGGEEIAVILTGTSLENSGIPLGRLLEKIANHKFSYGGEETNLTVSIGVSSNLATVANQKELIEQADKALYKAKQSGRNRVVKYSYDECDKVLQ